MTLLVKTLLVKTGGAAALAEWRALFAPLLPHLEVRWWDDPDVRPEDVAYAFVWAPEPGRIAKLPNLKLILSSGAGVDHLICDPSLPAHLPIVKMGAPEAIARMRDFVRATVFYHHRRLHVFAANQRARIWEDEETTEAANRTVGVMGLGTLGLPSALALRDAGFAVRAWSRTKKDIEGIETFAGSDALPRFLDGCEILLCLLASTPETAGVINATTLAALPRGACVINAARGAHVVVPDLLAALDSSHIAAATLDVFDVEPLPQDSPLWAHPRVLVTPHVASLAGRPGRARFVAEAIRAFEDGRELPNRFVPERGY